MSALRTASATAPFLFHKRKDPSRGWVAGVSVGDNPSGEKGRALNSDRAKAFPKFTCTVVHIMFLTQPKIQPGLCREFTMFMVCLL
jgi:hypothetical protein